MQIKIKRIDKTLPLPRYQTKGAVAFDFYSRLDVAIAPGETKLLPTNFVIQTPSGYMLMIAARSSLAKKRGLKMANSVGLIDQDYCGEEDEIQLPIHNYSNQEVKIAKGERISQGVFVPIVKVEFIEVDKMSEPSRGGFGTTGK